MSKETRAFEGQREGEVVELVFRRHILTAWRGVAWLMKMNGCGGYGWGRR